MFPVLSKQQRINKNSSLYRSDCVVYTIEKHDSECNHPLKHSFKIYVAYEVTKSWLYKNREFMAISNSGKVSEKRHENGLVYLRWLMIFLSVVKFSSRKKNATLNLLYHSEFTRNVKCTQVVTRTFDEVRLLTVHHFAFGLGKHPFTITVIHIQSGPYTYSYRSMDLAYAVFLAPCSPL